MTKLRESLLAFDRRLCQAARRGWVPAVLFCIAMLVGAMGVIIADGFLSLGLYLEAALMAAVFGAVFMWLGHLNGMFLLEVDA